MKTVLVPLDFSHEAGSGLEYAAALSVGTDLKIILVHAFHMSLAEELYTRIVPASASFKEDVRNQLLLYRDTISSKTGHIPRCLVEEGSLCEVIRKVQNEHKIDYIVMGTRGTKGLRKLFAGTHTSHILHSASCPVISVPLGTRFAGLKNISFATSYHRSDIAELTILREFAGPFKTTIRIFHLSGANEDPTGQIMNAFEKNVRRQISYDHLEFQIVNKKSGFKTMQDYIEVEKPDLLAISTRKRQYLERLLAPGLSDTLSFECKVPLLIFHQRTDPVIY